MVSSTSTLSGRLHVGYLNDTGRINKYVTIDAGIRWQQERMVGEDSHYVFNDDWSPRIGVTVDPIGDRKNKIFFNFGRYSYNLPLDLAERSLTNEKDLFSFRLTPAFTTDRSRESNRNGQCQRLSHADH